MARSSMMQAWMLASLVILALQAGGTDAAVCEPLSSSSPCAQFYPAGTNVTFPSFSATTPFNCQRDLDRLVFGTGTQTVWNVVSTLTPGTSCGMNVAQLMCMTMYRPCEDTVSDTVCSAAVGATANCPATIQTTLLPLLVSSWPTTFATCGNSSAFSPTGVTGVAAPLVLPRCEFLANTSVCKSTLNYPVYVPWKASQAFLEAKASGTLNAALVGITDPSCVANIKQVVCSQVFTKCDTYALIEALAPLVSSGTLPPATAGNLSALLPALQVAFPRLTCNSVCRSAFDTCGAETVAASPVLTNLLANNCSVSTPGTILPPSLQCDGSAVPSTGQPNFPMDTTTLGSATVAGQGVTITSTCSALDNTPCVALPASSVCAPFFPAGALVDVNPAFACYEDAEASLKAGPVIWDAIGMALASQPNSTCKADIAQLMCFVVFKPCNSFVSRSFCQSVMGINATAAGSTGSCSSQTLLLSTFIPGFASKFNCALNPIFQPEPLGVGVQVAQPPRVPQALCTTLSESSICRGVVDYPIYLPWNYYGDQSRIEQQVQRTFSNAFLLANTQTGCVTSIQKMLCSMVYTRCDTNVLAQSLAVAAPSLPAFPIPFPRLPCADLCATVQEQCGELLANSPSLATIANCTGVGFILAPTSTCGGVPVPGSAGVNFPTNSSVLASVTIGGTPVPIQSTCNAFISDYPSNASSVISCPFPLVGSSGPGDANAVFGGSCATPCPTFLFTQAEYDSGDRFFTGLTVTSFLMSTALWLTWIIFPIKRKQTNTLCFSTCTFLLSMAMLVIIGETDSHPSRVGCKNNSEFSNQDDGGVCTFQAIFFFYLTLAGVLFWLISALDLYIKIVLNKKIDLILQRKLNIAYLAVGWGLPFLFLIVALSVKAFGGSTGTPWCFFSTGSREYLDWLLFYYPIIVLVFMGSFFMVSIIWKMIVSARLTGSTKRAGWWKTQIRPFVFVFIFILIFTFIFAYRVHIYFKTDAYRLAGKQWVNCMLNSGSSVDLCGKKPSDTPNVGLWFLIQLAVAGQGILNSIIFGSQRVNAVLWWGLLTGRGVTYNGTNASTGTQDTSKSERTTGNGSERSRKSGEARPHLARTNSGRLDLSRKEQESKGFASAASSPARRPGQHIAPVSAQGVVGSYPYPQISAAATPVASSTVPASPSAIHPHATPAEDPSQI